MPKTTGRPFAKHTKLGRLMDERGLTAAAVSAETGIYTRTLSELLAGRKRPTPRSLQALSQFLQVPPDLIVEDEYPSVPAPARV